MAHDVFISYSHKDKATADAICSRLEKDGVRCWYAPRDVIPGTEWASAIIEAIGSARAMVLVFSDYSNVSSQVTREVSSAVNAGIPLIPFRLTDAEPRGSLQYFLSTVHWLDAVNDPVDRKTGELSEMVRRILGTEKPVSASEKTSPGKSASAGKGKRIGIILAAAAAGILALAGILWGTGVFSSREAENNVPAATEAPAASREFTIMRTDELETLTAEEKSGIRYLVIAGEYACNGELYGANCDPIINGGQGFLVHLETGERTPFSAGNMKDLHALEGMDNLTALVIFQNPLINVSGIEHFPKLISFTVGYCSSLTDVSEVFGMEKVKELAIIACPGIISIRGIHGMKGLIHLTLAFQQIPDYSELSAFEHLNELDMMYIDIDRWAEPVRNMQIDRLVVAGEEVQQDAMLALAEAHPEIVELHIYHGMQLTDLGFLTRMPNLTTVVITRNMELLKNTIDGSQAHFLLHFLDP